MPDGKTSIERYYRCLNNDNLLINGYFAKPINQRGQTIYNKAGYTIDCWKSVGSTYTLKLEDDGILITSPSNAGFIWDQALENASELEGKRVTASILISEFEKGAIAMQHNSAVKEITTSGLHSLTFTFTNDTNYSGIRFFNRGDTSAKFVAAFLEIGDHQTFAHKEGDTWVLNALPNPMLELLKCQQYYVRSDLIYAVKNGFTRNQMNCNCHFPVRMRAKPVVKLRSAYYDKPGVLSRFDDMSDTDIPAICNNATLTRDGFGSIATGDTTDGSYTLPNGIYAFKYEASAEP